MAKRTSKTASPLELVSGSVEETQAFGERIGQLLRPGDVVALQGELGSGKTTLIQGLAKGMGLRPDTVKSPTFVLMREYQGETPLIHIDGYRLEGSPQAAWLDLELLFSPHKVTVIEWAERFAELLPDERLTLQLSHVSTNRRRLVLHAAGSRNEELIAALKGLASEAAAQRGNESTGEQDHGTSGN